MDMEQIAAARKLADTLSALMLTAETRLPWWIESNVVHAKAYNWTEFAHHCYHPAHFAYTDEAEYVVALVNAAPDLYAMLRGLAAALDDMTAERDSESRWAKEYHDKLEQAQAERDAAIGHLLDCIEQACGDSDGEIDSMAITDYAEAMRFLADHGKLTVEVDALRRVIARRALHPEAGKVADSEAQGK